MKYSIIITLLVAIAFGSCNSKVEMDAEQQEVFDKLKVNDQQLFDLGFNKCDTSQLKKMISNDFEFYHDQAGITSSRQAFAESLATMCNMGYLVTREVIAESLNVHLLKMSGKTYGAIQMGQHQFYGESKDRPKALTSTADFTHLWIIEAGKWKLKRVLNYNHQAAEKKK